jgi:hypothetical protein
MAEDNKINLKLTPGELLIVAGAVVVLIFSFLHFYTAPSPLSGGVNAWASQFVPTATLIVLFTLVMAVHILLTRLLNVDLGARPAGFTWPQVHLALGFFATILSVAFLLVGKGGAKIGIGLVFMLIGSAVCLAGAILIGNEGAKA